MARIFESLSDEWVTYTPAVFDNRESEDPVTCEVRPMTVAEAKAYENRVGVSFIGAERMSRKRVADEVAKVRSIAAKILESRCRNVSNYAPGHVITTGADLAQFGESDMITDILDAITSISKLSEGLKKSSP
jgi:hypothetical protein